MDTSDDLKRIPPGRFSPPLAGTWKWDGNRELVFSSENPPIATQFTLTLNQEALRTRDDNPELAAAANALFGYPYNDLSPEHAKWLLNKKNELKK